MPDKPHTFVLVPGLWHGPWVWSGVVFELMVRGHRGVAVALPSTGAPDIVDSVEFVDDISAVVRSAVNAATRYGRPVVLVGQGYGCTLASAAAAHLDDMLAGLYYVAGVVEPERTLLDVVREQPLAEVLTFNDGVVSVNPADAVRVLYNDASILVAAEAARLLHPSSLLALTTEMPHRKAWESYPRGYMVCLADRALPGGWQAGEADHHGCEVDQCSGGHYPQLANFGYVADRLTAFAQRHFGQAA